MKYLKLYEDFSTEYPFTIADKVYTSSLYKDELASFTQYYGYSDTAKDELDWYLSTVDSIFKKGGVIYRGLYANSLDEIKGLEPTISSKLGQHWTLDYGEAKTLITQILKPHYNQGFAKVFIIEATTPPHNISIKNVDLRGNPKFD